MKFAFKVFNMKNGSPDPSQFTMDSMVANNEDEVYKIYNSLGQKIEITERIGQPTPSKAEGPVLAPGEIPAPAGIAPYRGGGVVPAPSKPQVIEFEDNGVKFKVENGSVYKKDWADVDMTEHRVTDSGRVQKLDWTKVK